MSSSRACFKKLYSKFHLFQISYKMTDRQYYEYYEWTDRYYEWTDGYYEWTNEYYEWTDKYREWINEYCDWKNEYYKCEKSITSNQASNSVMQSTRT